MPDIMSGKSKPEGAGTTKNDSPVIEMPKHRDGEYNPYNRHDKGQMGPNQPGGKK